MELSTSAGFIEEEVYVFYDGGGGGGSGGGGGGGGDGGDGDGGSGIRSLKVRHTPTTFNDFTSQNNGKPDKVFVMYYAARHSLFHLNVGTR